MWTMLAHGLAVREGLGNGWLFCYEALLWAQHPVGRDWDTKG